MLGLKSKFELQSYDIPENPRQSLHFYKLPCNPCLNLGAFKTQLFIPFALNFMSRY